jgi:hypothetical protein
MKESELPNRRKTLGWETNGGWLKPCPFCGNNTSAVEIVDNKFDFQEIPESPQYTVCCCMTEQSLVPSDDWKTGCGATAGWAKTPSDAAEKWNRRRP